MLRQNNSVDIWLVVTVLVLAGLGIVMVYSSTMYKSLAEGGSGSDYFVRQAIRLVMGVVAMMLLTKVNYRGYATIALPLLVIGFALLLLLLGQKMLLHERVHRWLRLGPLSFQPSEVMKVIMVIYLSAAIAGMGVRIREFKHGLFPLLCVIGMAFALVLVQPDLGISGLILVTSFFLLFIGRAKLWHLLLLTAPAVAGVVLVATKVSYMKKRIDIFLHPELHPQDAYQILQSITGIGSGGFFGVGLGNSTLKYLFLPESHTDFVFSILAEELGFVGSTAILLLSIVFVWRGMKIAQEAPDMFGFLLASGLSAMIGFQTFINIGVATAVLPTTGMTLPFISYGGSSLLLTFCATGILLNISRQGSYERRLSREFGIRLHRRVLA